MGFGQVESHAKKSAKHKAHLKSHLSSTVFCQSLNDSTDANIMCSASNSVTVKLTTKNTEWMLLTFIEKKNQI